MRSIIVLLLASLWIGCGPGQRGNGGDAPPPPADACEDGLRCRVTDCQKQGKPPTSISGTVFAPNGTLPLYGVTVYVPNTDPGFFTDGAQCTRCENRLPGDPIAQTISDDKGNFKIEGVPSGENVPLIVTIGKWRRQVKIPFVSECADNQLTPSQTSLPKKKLEGEMPKIAIITGSCDALECLIRKLGVDVSEFTPDSGDGRIHMFASNGASRNVFNQTFAPASALWSSVDKLKQYDMTMFSCECSQQAAAKPQAALDALKAYADAGGRAFLSHYNSIWISGEYNNPTHAPPVWPSIATCQLNSTTASTGVIDEVNNPRGPAFARWMVNVGGSTSHGRLSISQAKQTCSSIDNTKAERWVYVESGANQVLQNFQFTTPNEVIEEERCGKVVFSDMHVASGSSSSSGTPFPNGCSAGDLTPQEKALAFMFFDIATCVGPIF